MITGFKDCSVAGERFKPARLLPPGRPQLYNTWKCRFEKEGVLDEETSLALRLAPLTVVDDTHITANLSAAIETPMLRLGDVE